MCCLAKRIIAAFLAAVLLVLSLAACNKDGEGTASSAEQSAEASRESSEESAPTQSGEGDKSTDEDSETSFCPVPDSCERSEYPSEEESETSAPTSSDADTDSSVSTGDGSTPEPDSSVPVEESATPEPESSEPVEESTTPEPDSSVPVEESTTPEPDSSAPVEESSTPEPDSSVPVEESTTPEPESSAPVEESSAPEPVLVGPDEPVCPLPDSLAVMASVDKFFDNSVFTGYSIMMHFGKYVNEWRQQVDSSILGGAVFCAGVGISFTADRTDGTLPTFRGKEYHFYELPAATGSDTIYINLMGYSDLKWASSSSNCVQYAYDETVQGIQRIRNANPSVNIVILANTYNTGVYESLSRSRCSNDKVRQYNNLVLEYCNKNGIDFLDVATPLLNGSGYFIADWSTDNEYHIQKTAYYNWMAVLRDYAVRKQNGTWENITVMPAAPFYR